MFVSPRKDASTFHYIADGTGRDSYVIPGDGGLHANYRYSGPHIPFVRSLRSNVNNRYAETTNDYKKNRKFVKSANRSVRISYHPWYPEKIRQSLKDSAEW